MKLRTLLKRLSKFDQDLEVFIYWPYGADIEHAVRVRQIDDGRLFIVAENPEWYMGIPRGMIDALDAGAKRGTSKITREEISFRFNEGDFNCIIAHPTCFKYGTDLSRADTMIYYTAPLGLETRLQSEARMTRIKKKESVLIIDLIVEDSIEEDILKGLQMKKSQSEIIKMMVRRLNEDTYKNKSR